MADAGFNGSTITIGTGDEVPLRSIRHSSPAAAVDLTGSSDLVKTYVRGIPDPEITFDTVGATDLSTADAAAAIVIAWNDGTGPVGSEAGTWLIINVEVNGDLDGEIISSITCKPATAA